MMLTWHPVRGDEPLSTADARLVERIATSRSYGEAASGYRELLDQRDRVGIERLESVPEVGIALQAAWERVRACTLPPDEKGRCAVDAQAAERFLAQVQRRTGIKPPTWWSEAVKRTLVTRWGDLYSPVDFNRPVRVNTLPSARPEDSRRPLLDFNQSPREKMQDDETTILTPAGISLREMGDEWRLAFGDDKGLAIPRRTASRVFSEIDANALSMDADRCFVAAPVSFLGFYLTCLDRADGRILWQAAVWGGSGRYRGHTGQASNRVEVVEHADCVTVIGATGAYLYIESFERGTGRNAFRFCTGLSEEGNEEQGRRKKN
jgi:hypothetical protein